MLARCINNNMNKIKLLLPYEYDFIILRFCDEEINSREINNYDIQCNSKTRSFLGQLLRKSTVQNF